ncbi:MAG: spirocyclase AveC family protein [Solirubrobacteraceae bacterium]
MDTVTAAPAPRTGIQARLQAPTRTARPAVVWWALLGAVVLAAETYILIRWVTGPHFKAVPSGPSTPPGWMKVVLILGQTIEWPIAVGVIYFTLIRPWRRERRAPTRGLLVLAYVTAWPQDPISSYFGHWFTYNSWMFNRGTWTSYIPGWSSFGKPGQELAAPVLWLIPQYAVIWGLGVAAGLWGLHRARARWPRLGPISLVAITFLFTVVFDLLFEGLVYMPLGFFAYPGGHLSLFPSTYHTFPIHEAIFVGATITGLVAMREFTNDRGETFAERGVSSLRLSDGRRVILRFFAIAGAMQTLFFLLYNLPVGLLVAPHSAAWPADLQKRSYLTDYLCGAGTDRACPAPGIPGWRGNDTIHITPSGRLVVPPGVTLPKLVPFGVSSPSRR